MAGGVKVEGAADHCFGLDGGCLREAKILEKRANHLAQVCETDPTKCETIDPYLQRDIVEHCEWDALPEEALRCVAKFVGSAEEYLNKLFGSSK